MRPSSSIFRSLSTLKHAVALSIGLLICLTALASPVLAAAPLQGQGNGQGNAPEKVTLVIKTARGLTQAQADSLVRGHGGTPKGAVSKLDLQIIEVPANAADAIIKAMKGDAQIQLRTDRIDCRLDDFGAPAPCRITPCDHLGEGWIGSARA